MDNFDYKIITGIRYDNLSDNLNILNRNSIEPISSLDNDIARKLEMDNTIDTSDIEFNINEKFKDGWTFCTINDSLIVNHIKKNNKLGFLHYSIMMCKPKDAYKDEDGIWRVGPYGGRYILFKECKILTNMKSNELTDKINDYTNNGWSIGKLLVEKAVHNNNEYLYFTELLVKEYKY